MPKGKGKFLNICNLIFTLKTYINDSARQSKGCYRFLRREKYGKEEMYVGNLFAECHENI